MTNYLLDQPNDPFKDFSLDDMPSAVDLEYALIGVILSRNEVIDQLSFLDPNHFYAAEHRTIYAKMLDLSNSGQRITPFSLAPLLARPLQTEIKYLANAMVESNAMIHPVEDARILVDLAERRNIIATCQEHILTIKKRTKTSSEHIADLASDLENCGARGAQSHFLNDREVTQLILRDLENQVQPYSTGIGSLDTAMDGGLYPGRNYYIMGRKKMGKTTLAGSISCNLSRVSTAADPKGVTHLYIAAEMGIKRIQQRNLSRLTNTASSSFRTKVGKTDMFQKKISDQIPSSNGAIIYLNAPGITFERMRRAIAQAISLYKIRGVIVDSLQLVGGAAPNRRVEHQDEVAQWIADYCLEHNIFSIVTAQMNQTGNVRFGEGCRLSCDMAFEVRAPEDDPSHSGRWLEMIETRDSMWINVGSASAPRLRMYENGPYIHDSGDANFEQEPMVF